MTATLATPLLRDFAAQVYKRVSEPLLAVETEATDIIGWAEQFFYIPETLAPITLSEYQKDLLRFIFPEPPGPGVRYPFTTIVWSEPKKSGKSAIGALFGRWAAETWENFGEVYCAANDLEQSRGRNFNAIRLSIDLPNIIKGQNPSFTIPSEVLRRLENWNTPKQKPVLTYSRNGSKVFAISGDYAGAAGGNPSAIIFSELWGYVSENSRRLYTEMTTVPTRLNSIRWIETYAGYTNESDLLWEVYQTGLRGEPVGQFEGLSNPDGSPAVRINEKARMLFFWSHTPRQDWQTEEYYEQQRIDLRPHEFKRLHGNEWVSRESDFIPPELWDGLENPAVIPLRELLHNLGPQEKVELCLGLDASKNRDCTALVGVVSRENPENRHAPFVDLALVRIWEAEYDDFLQKTLIDLDQTIGAALRELHGDNRIKIKVAAYDPYQLHSIMTTFAKNTRIDCEEVPQTDRRVESDTNLLDLIRQKRLRIYNEPKLRQHILNAVAKERPRGIRIDKEATAQKIDGAVALSMAAWAALYYVPRTRRFVSV